MNNNTGSKLNNIYGEVSYSDTIENKGDIEKKK